MQHIFSLLRIFISLPKKGVKTRQKSSFEKQLKIPITIGSCSVYYGLKIQLNLNYYFDYFRINNKWVYLFGLKILYVFNYINKYYKNIVELRTINLYKIRSLIFPEIVFNEAKNNYDDVVFNEHLTRYRMNNL